MRKFDNLTRFTLALLLLTSVFAVHAKDKPINETLDCSTDSLPDLLDTLNPAETNVVEITGDCPGLITIAGFSDLTLIGIDGGSISGTYVEGDQSASTTALEISGSRVTLRDVTLNSGLYGLFCTDRSTCVVRDAIVQGGHFGVAAQGQSALDIQGATQIQDNAVWGVSVFGASSVNMRPNWDTGFDPAEAGPVITGNGVGAWVQDGSFFRSDNVSFTGNGTGVWAQRDAVLKIFANASGLGVTDNAGTGLVIRQNTSLQIFAPVSGNGGSGIQLGALSYLQADPGLVNGNGGEDVACVDVTAISFLCPSLTATIADLQARIDALEAEANASLAEKVAGKTYAYRTTGHGIGGLSGGAPDLPLALENPSRDFSGGEGTLSLNDDGTWSVEIIVTGYPATLFPGEGSVIGFLDRFEFTITDGGTWATNEATGEILLDNTEEVQRLQASPNGEVLTVVANDLRINEGDPTVPGFFLTFIADAVYIQLPQ